MSAAVAVDGGVGAARNEGAGAAGAEGTAVVGPVNEVVLVGRVAAPAEQREMPSGDVMTTFRLVVDRPPRKLPEGVRPTTVDTLDCVVWTAGLRRTVGSWQAGDVVRVEGAVRRRFWRAGVGAASRCEVEVAKARRLAKAG